MAPGGPVPGTGKVVRVAGGQLEVVADGLMFPTAMTFGPRRWQAGHDHGRGRSEELYVSNFGFGFAPGAGQILRITIPER